MHNTLHTVYLHLFVDFDIICQCLWNYDLYSKKKAKSKTDTIKCLPDYADESKTSDQTCKV